MSRTPCPCRRGQAWFTPNAARGGRVARAAIAGAKRRCSSIPTATRSGCWARGSGSGRHQEARSRGGVRGGARTWSLIYAAAGGDARRGHRARGKHPAAVGHPPPHPVEILTLAAEYSAAPTSSSWPRARSAAYGSLPAVGPSAPAPACSCVASTWHRRWRTGPSRRNGRALHGLEHVRLMAFSPVGVRGAHRSRSWVVTDV